MTEEAIAPGRDIDFTIAEIRRSKGLFLVCAGLALILALFYLRAASYTYTVEMTVVPVRQEGSGISSKIGSLASVVGAGSSSDAPVAPFDLYIEQLHSRLIADKLSQNDALMHRIFAGEWDAVNRRWKQPRGVITSISHTIKRVIGIPITPWRKPDGARLQNYLGALVKVDKGTDKPLATVKLDHADPAFGVSLMDALHATTNDLIRQRAQLRATQYIDYLNQKLPTVTVMEQRGALASLLLEQERTKMLASSSMPYAADQIDFPHASASPTKPMPLLVLAGSLLVGLALALAIILVRMQLRRKA